MGTKALKNHPGMWLREDAADAINALEDKYGPIVINRAGVTEAQQQEVIDRWDKGGTYNRPPYLFPPARPAKSSNHVKDGGIAVDVYNYTSDRAKLNEFGFEWYGPSDYVHYTFKGRPGSSSQGRPGYQDGSAELKSFQEKLIRMGHNLGPAGADGILGDYTANATKHEQKMAPLNGYKKLAVDGIPGPETNGYLDWWLAGRPGFGGGRPSSKSAGELTYLDIQQALNRKGYGLAEDGIWGKKSSNALADFQAKNGLRVDRLVGPLTWDKLNTF
ncbi:lysin A [Microbacterium phage McGalleon]|uniref:Lysin A n=1 Tax=Microbacterium phage McGalleon TaxID=2590936 RepID=A0A516KQV1_9CAUD|nr:endolysin [Microbacterium phage McGalleon]QDP44077.1 lysin A [Microbacterium phage McGalleon]